MILLHPVIEQDAVDLAVHEDMNQLVPDDVAKIPHRTVVWNDDAPFEKLEETADAFRDKVGRRVRLLEVKVRAVKNERDAIEDVMIELLLEHAITLFGKVCTALREILHLRIIIDVEVFGLEDMPIEISILDFIAAEGEELRGGGGNGDENDDAAI